MTMSYANITPIIGIVLGTFFLSIYADETLPLLKVHQLNGCFLKYKKHVSDKPDIFFTLKDISGLCRLRKDQNNSTENYETLKIEYYDQTKSNNSYWPNGPGPVIPGTIQRYNTSLYQGLNYDSRTKSLIYLERINYNGKCYSTIVQRYLDASQLVEESLSRNHTKRVTLDGCTVDNLAYDWRTNNIFLKNASGIFVMNFNKTWKPMAVVLHDRIRSFAIHPNAGYLFYVQTDESAVKVNWNSDGSNPMWGPRYYVRYDTRIHRTNLDGSNMTMVGPDSYYRYGNIDNLAIDYHTDRLYWSVRSDFLVQNSKLDGTDVKNVYNKELFSARRNGYEKSITFDKKYIYYLLSNQKIRRVDKETLKEDEDFEIDTEGEGMIISMVVYDSEAQQITADHACSIDNGGCPEPEYCFILPKSQSEEKPYRICRQA